MDSPQPPVIVTPAQRRLMVFLKLGSICLLLALLQIPLVMTRGVLAERQGYQAQAVAEIRNTWGQAQMIAGPVLAVPYSITRQWDRETLDAQGEPKTVKEISVTWDAIYFLPAALDARAEIDPEVRYRGIYDTVVYSAQIALKGTFKTDLMDVGPEGAVYQWEKAVMYMGVTDARRLRSAPHLVADGKSPPVEAEATEGAILNLKAKTPATGPNQAIDFEVKLDLQGSERLEIAPVGKATVVQMHSKWANPSFTGSQLPVTRIVNEDGFTASWRLAHYGRGFPQTWNGARTGIGQILPKIVESGFGVAFNQPVNSYSMAERAQKYGILFFVLVFTVFFLFEVTAALRIHPLQYALVGVALCLFFLGFLALSEFWPTRWAYAAAATGCTLMVSLYAWSFLKTGWRTLVIGGGLGATYGYLYFVLKSQDYALVAGTAALFGALALVMFCTRRINWYDLDVPGTQNGGAARQ